MYQEGLLRWFGADNEGDHGLGGLPVMAVSARNHTTA